MIPALIGIGQTLSNRYPMPLVEEPYPKIKPQNPPKVLVIELESSSSGLVVVDFLLEDYDPQKNLTKYYFRNPSAAQGPAPSLSIKLPPKASALKQRLGILENLGYKTDISQLADEIAKHIETLKNEGKIRKNASILLVLKIDNKWPADNESLKSSFKRSFFENLGQKRFRKDWKKDWICHGCGEKKIVYGGVGELLKFYTVDKYGYAPELDPKGAWRQYSLCEDCLLDLERGKRACEEFLTYSFYGKSFWLLPVSSQNLKQILERFENFHKSGG
ncbi:MAG: TM1802 family CRISPR-associated protein, partial [Desulfonauticus sp.]|nr:TM1802 family CRISPR-associated protein [Desulfonauticus sp.]